MSIICQDVLKGRQQRSWTNLQHEDFHAEPSSCAHVTFDSSLLTVVSELVHRKSDNIQASAPRINRPSRRPQLRQGLGALAAHLQQTDGSIRGAVGVLEKEAS